LGTLADRISGNGLAIFTDDSAKGRSFDLHNLSFAPARVAWLDPDAIAPASSKRPKLPIQMQRLGRGGLLFAGGYWSLHGNQRLFPICLRFARRAGYFADGPGWKRVRGEVVKDMVDLRVRVNLIIGTEGQDRGRKVKQAAAR
jgi:hypothetical protein